MNSTKIITMSALALFTATMIVACGPKDRNVGGVRVTQTPDGTLRKEGANPQGKVSAIPQNPLAQDAIKNMIADKDAMEEAKQLMSAIKDVAVVAAGPNLNVLIKVDGGSLVVSIPALGDPKTANVIPIDAISQADAQITAYYVLDSGLLDSIQIHRKSTADKAASKNANVIYHLTYRQLAVTPVTANEAQTNAAKAKLVDPILSANITKVVVGIQDAEKATAVPHSFDAFAKIESNKSHFQTVVIPTSKSKAFDDSTSLIAYSIDLRSKEAGSSATTAGESLAEGSPSPVGITSPLSFPLLITATTSGQKSEGELDLKIAVGAAVSGSPAGFSIHLAPTDKGSVTGFDDAPGTKVPDSAAPAPAQISPGVPAPVVSAQTAPQVPAAPAVTPAAAPVVSPVAAPVVPPVAAPVVSPVDAPNADPAAAPQVPAAPPESALLFMGAKSPAK